MAARSVVNPMNAVGFAKLLDHFGSLSVDQLNQAKQALNERESQVEGLLVIREREKAVACCAHCNDQRIVRYGRRRERQRYKCKACGRTFNVLTGTALAGLRLPEKHIENARCMSARLSLNEAAQRLDVAVSTAFRWRHRFLERLSALNPEQLSGVVEVDETFFLESFKGQRRGLPRKAKKRGTPAVLRGLSREQIPVLVARDRSVGATLSQQLAARDFLHIGPVLVPKLSKDAVLVTDGASAYKLLGRAHNIEVRQVPRHPKHRTTGLTHLNNVNAYDQRLKKWMIGFVGVATKYLPNYLGWHRWLDANAKTKTGRRLLQASIGWN